MPLLRIYWKRHQPHTRYTYILYTDIRNIIQAVHYTMTAHLSIQVCMGADLYSPIEFCNQTPLGILLNNRFPRRSAIKLLVSNIDVLRLYKCDRLVCDTNHNFVGLGYILAAGARDIIDTPNVNSGLRGAYCNNRAHILAVLLTCHNYTEGAVDSVLRIHNGSVWPRRSNLLGMMYSFRRQTRRFRV